MKKALTVAVALIAAAPALADPPAASSDQTRVPRISRLLETVVDNNRGVYIRADTGQWYYARTRAPCARLRPTASPLGFEANPQGELDRYGAVRAEGWRCQLDSVTESAPPPGRARG